MGIGGAPAPVITNVPPPQRAIPGASVPAITPSPSVTTFGNNQIGVVPGSNSSMRGGAGMNGFGPVNARAVVSPTTPGRAANMPGPAGSANANSAFQPAGGPFVQNPQAAAAAGVPANQGTGTGLAGLPASAFTTQVARPTPPGPTSSPSNPSFFPLYLPNGAVNPYVGPNAPMANGQVNGQLNAAQATASGSAKCRPKRNGFPKRPVVASSAGGYWEYYRGNRWNSLPAAAGERTTSSSASASAPISGATSSSSSSGATPTYSYDVPAYSP